MAEPGKPVTPPAQQQGTPEVDTGKEVGELVGEKAGETYGEVADGFLTATTGGAWGLVDKATGGFSSLDKTVGKAVGGFVGDHSGDIADGAMTVATGGLWLGVDAVTGGFSAMQEKQEKEAQHQNKFNDTQKHLDSAGSVKMSDDLLNDGAFGLKFFEEFLPRMKNWAGQAPDFKGEICHTFDELREIDFSAFREDAGRLEQVHKVLLDQNDHMNQAFEGAGQTWKGKAADAAQAKVGKYVGAGTTVANETEKLAGAITPAIDGIEKMVKEYSKFVLGLGKEIKCAGKAPEEVDAEIRKARGDLKLEDLTDVGLDDIFGGIGAAICNNPVQTAAGFILGSTPLGPLLGVSNAENVCKEIRQHVIDDAKKWLDGSFKPEMQKKLGEFKQQSTNTQQQIQQAYDKLTQAGNVSDDPFKALKPADNQGTDGQGNGHSTGDSQTGSGRHSGSKPGGGDKAGAGDKTGGGGMPPGGGTPPAGGGQMPKTPQMPPMPGGAPGGMPGGAEHPGPVPGQPGPGGAPQEEVSIGEGKDKVTVGEPGHNGHSKVTLIGPDGQPKTYDVAFPPDGQQPGQPGQPTPGMPGAGGTPVQPGPDGKAVIHEGDRSITLERTPDGQVKVGIDNGRGQPPTNQTIGFGHAQSAGPAGMPGQQAGPGGAQPAFAGGAGMPAGGNSFGSASGQLFGGPEGAAPQGSVGAGGAGAGGAVPHGGGGGAGGGMPGGHPAGSVGPGGSAGVAAGGPGTPAPSAPVASGQPGAGQGGMGQGGSGAMMGGMGAMGSQGQGGGDQERQNSSPWRTEGQLFEDGVNPSSVAFSGVIGEDRNKKR